MKPSDFRLVVASGPTREWIDPVRFISNPSTGRTGWFIARAGLDLGFREVVLISGPGVEEFRTLDGGQTVRVDTTAEMTSAVRDQICDGSLLIMSAAPADYTPVQSSDRKLKKNSGVPMTITFAPTTDILKSIIPLAARWPNFYRVGFAAETHDLEQYALRKLKEKNLDFICGNEVFKGEAGFGDRENTLLIIDKSGKTAKIGPYAKRELARRLLDHLITEIP